MNYPLVESSWNAFICYYDGADVLVVGSSPPLSMKFFEIFKIIRIIGKTKVKNSKPYNSWRFSVTCEQNIATARLFSAIKTFVKNNLAELSPEDLIKIDGIPNEFRSNETSVEYVSILILYEDSVYDA